MRTCSHCGHKFEDQNVSPPACPACGRAFTVSDIGSATIEFDVTASQVAAAGQETMVDPAPGQSPPTPAQANPPGSLTTPEQIGMTIQSDRWAPTKEELEDAAASSGALQTLDSSFLGPLMGASGGVPAGPTVAQMTQMWDSSHVWEQGGSSLHGQPGSSQPGRSQPGSSARSGSVASSAAEAALSQSLEQSLVIQPRVLREGRDEATSAANRIDYNLLSKLGEGGMGIVYAARQQSIRRVVALKMLKNLGGEEASHREKFLAEAVITGDLEHPNIVPIYDLGRDEAGAIFYAMKHVKGTPWDKLIQQKSLHENLEILMKVADAVAFAHSKDVVHRDLKPENVMLGDFGEVLVMDWGLAISVATPPMNMAMGGTPAYMAPEMAMGPVEMIGVCSDVYLLGAILYEFVTGLRPHVGSTVTRCLMAAAKNEIVPTQKTGELVEIALRAMASQPKDRYASVRDFQNAIREYQSHSESIVLAARAEEDLKLARETSEYETYARALFAYQEAAALWDGNARAKAGVSEAALAYAECARSKEDFDLGLSLLDEEDPNHTKLILQLQHAQQERDQRNQRLRTARRVGVGLVAMILVIVTGAFFWIRAEANRARAAELVAKNEKAEAVRQKGVAEEQRAKAIAAQLEEEKQRKAAEEAERTAIAARVEEEKQRKAAEEAERAAIAARMEEEKQRKAAEEAERTAVAARIEEKRQRDLADIARKQEEYEAYIAKIGLAAAKIEENAFDHALALINECPAHLRHWEWGRLNYLCTRDVQSYDVGAPIEAIAISPDGKRLATGGWGGDVRILAIDTGEQLAAIPTGATYVFALAFSPDGERLAIGSNAKPDYLSIHEAASGKHLKGLSGHRDAVLSVAWSKDGAKLLTGSYDDTARLWDEASGKSQAFAGHDWWVWSAAFSPDEQRIVTGSQDGSAMLWDIKTGEASPPFLGHTGPVYSAAFSPDGQFVATGSYDKRVLLWRPEDLKTQDLEQALANVDSGAPPTPVIPLESHTASVRSVKFSGNGKMLLSSGNDNAICVWDLDSRSLVKQLRGHASRVSAAVFAPGDDRIVSGGYDHSARLWSISQYEEMKVLGGRVLNGHRDSILGAAFSPNGKLVVTASRDRTAIAWDVASGQQLRSYSEGHAYLASAAIFFPDGKRVLTSAVDNTTRIWDMSAGTQLAMLEGTGTSAAVALPKSGEWIATGSNEKTVQIWTPEGERLRKLEGFSSDVTALAVAPGDKQILTGDGVGRCRLLDIESGNVLWESRSHSRGVTAAAFTQAGDWALTASLDNTVAQWNVKTGKEDTSRLMKHPDGVTALAISADGSRALTACADKVVRLWDVATAKVLLIVPTGDVAATDVAFAPDGHRGLTTMADNRVRLWNLDDGTEISPPGEKAGPFLDLSATTLLAWSAAFSADGQRLLTVGGAEAHLWDAVAAKPLMAFAPQSAVSSVQFSKTGEQFVTGSWDNAARIWNTATGAALIRLGGVHTRFVNASVFSPDGTKVLTASDDQTIGLWDATSGKLLGKFVGHKGRVADVTFSSDGKLVLTASDDKTARIWDAATFEVRHVLEGHEQAVLCARFSADDQRVISGSDDTTARLWNAATGEALPIVLQGHTASVTSVGFAPDGLRALTGSKDITTKLWDPATGKEILTLTGHTQEITTVAVSPDGNSILTGSRDGTAIVWLTTPWKAEPQPVVLAVPKPSDK